MTVAVHVDERERATGVDGRAAVGRAVGVGEPVAHVEHLRGHGVEDPAEAPGAAVDVDPPVEAAQPLREAVVRVGGRHHEVLRAVAVEVGEQRGGAEAVVGGVAHEHALGGEREPVTAAEVHRHRAAAVAPEVLILRAHHEVGDAVAVGVVGDEQRAEVVEVARAVERDVGRVGPAPLAVGVVDQHAAGLEPGARAIRLPHNEIRAAIAVQVAEGHVAEEVLRPARDGRGRELFAHADAGDGALVGGAVDPLHAHHPRGRGGGVDDPVGTAAHERDAQGVADDRRVDRA